MSERWDVVVIGAGHNGLAAAAWLAGRHLRVLVLERREVVGGLAAGEEFHPGYRSSGVLPDTGSMRPWIIEALGLERHGLELLTREAPILVPPGAGDGNALVLWRDPASMTGSMTGSAGARCGAGSALAGADVKAYAGYRAFLDKLAPVLRRLFDAPPLGLEPSGLGEALRGARLALAVRGLGRRDMMELLRIAPMCAADWLREWFADEALQAALAAPALWATFTGPFSPGSSFNLLLSECLRWREIRGGAAALALALERAARARGVEIRTGVAVKELALERASEGSRVAGVVLGSEELIPARAVAAACDPKHLFLELLSPAHRPRALEEHAAQIRTRGTSAKLELALCGPPRWRCAPELAAQHVRLGASLEALERAYDPVKYRRFSERLLLEVTVPSIARPELAPPGHHVLEALVHFVPYELEGGWSETRREELYRGIVAQLEEEAPGLGALIQGRRLLLPPDLERVYGTTGGHLHHGEHAIDQLLVRPTPECARHRTPYPGLYLCGSGSHPGGGLTCAPGAFGARALLADLRR